MDLFKDIKKIFLFLVSAISILCISFLMPLNLKSGEYYALTDVDSAVKIEELWNSSQGSFNSENLEILIEKLFGTEDPVEYIKADENQSEVAKSNGTKEKEFVISGSNVVNARTINEKVGNAENGLVVTLGGRNWIVTSLTLANRFESDADNDRIVENDDVIVTLYMADDYETASAMNNATNFNCYSASILRNKILSWEDFKLFSSGEFAENYLVQPKYIKYQEVETVYGRQSPPEGGTCSPNDAYGVAKSESVEASWSLGGYSDPEVVINGVKYNEWKNDYIWIPSVTETGYKDRLAESSIWRLTVKQLEHSVQKYSWLRSGNHHYIPHCYYINKDGSWYGTETTTSCGVRPAMHFNLTKALENVSGAKVKTPEDITTTYNGSTQKLSEIITTLGTNAPKWYKSSQKYYTNNEYIKLEYETASGVWKEESALIASDFNDVGEYWMRATLQEKWYEDVRQKYFEATQEELNELFPRFATADISRPSNYTGTDSYIQNDTYPTRYFKVKISKAPISIFQLQVDELGNLTGLVEGQSISDYLIKTLSNGTIYQRDIDNSTAPEMVLQYKRADGSWSETLPTTAGVWYVRASIKNVNTCNYELIDNGETAFNRGKDYISLPYFYNNDPNIIIENTTTSVNYSGSSQVLSLFNNVAHNALTGILIGNRSTGLLYSSKTGEFSVTGVGTYTVEISLADPDNTQWADKSTETKRTITLVVKPAELVVTIDEASKTSWSKGERNFKIKIYVDGIIENDAVKIDASYGLVGSSTVSYVTENNMEIDTTTHRMTIVVDTTNLSINQKYFLDISLKDNVAINKNYVLVNNTGEWEFMLTSSKIKQEDITEVWTYTNIIAGTADFASTTTGSVLYNEAEYIVKLNPAYIPVGVEVTYSGTTSATNSNNSKTNNITAILTTKEGYSFEEGVQTTYTFTWTITPVECDLSSLVWAQDFEYNGKTQVMQILNLPSWLVPQATYTGNTARVANPEDSPYTAVCSVGLTQYGNHTFTNRLSSVGISISINGRSATITHNWQIKKAKIQVSNYADLWLVESIRNAKGDIIDLRVPKAMQNFKEQIILKYYKDSACTQEVLPKDMTLVKEEGSDITTPTPYYAKVELNSSYADNYELENVSEAGATYAVLMFNVGGIRAIIRLTVDEELIYNGKAQTVSVTSNNTEYNELVTNNKAGYTIKYYSVIDDSDNYGTEEIEPKHVGRYVAVIFVSDLDDGDNREIVNEYIVYCHTHFFNITQLKLTTNWSFTADGNTAIPVEGVTANNDSVNVKDFYNYTIFDSTGQNEVPASSLAFNTRYLARLSLKDTTTNTNGLANVVLLDANNDDVTFTNITEYAFTTGQNPKAPAVVLDNPEIFGLNTVIYDKQSHDIVIRLRDNISNTYISSENILNYVTIELKNNSEVISRSEDILSQTNAGVYNYVVKIKSGANASWLWGEVNEEKMVTYTIDKKPIVATNLQEEYEWTGNPINVWTDDASWLEWVSVVGTYIATDLGEYNATFELLDKVNTYWDNRALVNSGTETNDINLAWEITKVKIIGGWKENSEGYLVYNVLNSEHNEFIESKYLDSKGNVITPDKFVEGEKYTAIVSVKDSEHYELTSENKGFEKLEAEFEYQRPLSSFEKALKFIKANWLWFVIGIACLLLFIIIIIIGKRRKNKAEDKVKAELEKKNEELEKKLDRVLNQTGSPQMFGGYQMPPIQAMPASIMPSMITPQASLDKERLQDLEIQQLREMVTKMARYQIASDEEKSKSDKLAKTEKMLMQFILNEFANNPDWIPFTNQDMIDYDINDLMNLYLKAKQIKTQKLAMNNNLNEQNLLKQESQNFESKVAEYNKQKEDSKYEELLRAIREVSDAQKELKNSQDELKDSQKKLEEKVNNADSQNSSPVQIKINQTEKLAFDEAFNELPANQKRYFAELKDYALKQPNAKQKSAKQHFSIGSGNNIYVKFVIKYSTLIAVLGTTEVKLENDNSIEVVKQMIDTRVKKFQEKI